MWCFKQIFDFTLTEDDMRALRGLDRGWQCYTIDE